MWGAGKGLAEASRDRSISGVGEREGARPSGHPFFQFLQKVKKGAGSPENKALSGAPRPLCGPQTDHVPPGTADTLCSQWLSLLSPGPAVFLLLIFPLPREAWLPQPVQPCPPGAS